MGMRNHDMLFDGSFLAVSKPIWQVNMYILMQLKNILGYTRILDLRTFALAQTSKSFNN